MGNAFCSLTKPELETERSASGVDVLQEDTLDSDTDSESTESLWTEDEMDSEDSLSSEQEQTVLENYETSVQRVGGIIQVHCEAPTPDRVQDFWAMVVEKQIPTILMHPKGSFPRHYMPCHSSSTLKCGVFTVQRIGHIVAISLSLTYQSLIIYRNDGVSDVQHKVLHFKSMTGEDYEEVVRRSRGTANPQILMHDG